MGRRTIKRKRLMMCVRGGNKNLYFSDNCRFAALAAVRLWSVSHEASGHTPNLWCRSGPLRVKSKQTPQHHSAAGGGGGGAAARKCHMLESSNSQRGSGLLPRDLALNYPLEESTRGFFRFSSAPATWECRRIPEQKHVNISLISSVVRVAFMCSDQAAFCGGFHEGAAKTRLPFQKAVTFRCVEH